MACTIEHKCLHIDEEEVLMLANLGNGANSKDTIDTFKRSLVMWNRFIPQIFFFLQISYVEKVVQCWTF